MITRITILLLAFVVTGCNKKVTATDKGFAPFEGPNPVAIFIQTDPWAMVIGSDTPRFALYDDRTVVFMRKEDDHYSLRHAKLEEKEFDELRQRFEIVAELPALKNYYNITPHLTSQPKAMFCIHRNEEFVTSTVYGLKSADTKLPAWSNHPTDQKPDVPPEELLSLHKFLVTFDVPEAAEWQPEYVEVLISPYENAPDESIHWPKDWPSLDSEQAFQRGGSYSIFLGGEKLDDLRKLLATRTKKGAIEIGQKKWASSYRFVFPSEPVWQKSFKEGRVKAAERSQKG